MMMGFIAEHWTGLVTILASIMAFGSSCANRKKIHQVHHLFNGRLTDFLEAERKLNLKALEDARADGYAQAKVEAEKKWAENITKLVAEKKDEGYQG